MKTVLELLVYMVGYETRSAHVVGVTAATVTLGIVAGNNQHFSFEENLKASKSRRSLNVNENDLETNFEFAIDEALQKVAAKRAGGVRPTVGVDVSSLSRKLMSIVLRDLFERASKGMINLRILYAEGQYQPPQKNPPPFLDLAPIEGLEGWSLYPERPLSVIVGLGYEPDLASAAIEFLDPSGIWVFIAEGSEPRFRMAAMEANASVLHVVEDGHLLSYRPEGPRGLFAQLLSLVETLANRSRVVMVTGGPKIFWAIAMLAKLRIGDEVAVWRVSTHDHTEPRDTHAAGNVIEFDYVPSRG